MDFVKKSPLIQNFKLYENSDFRPTDEMLDNASLCFKEEVFENIINNESEEYQKILESEIKIFDKHLNL